MQKGYTGFSALPFPGIRHPSQDRVAGFFTRHDKDLVDGTERYGIPVVPAFF
jgi:hypothetical protein